MNTIQIKSDFINNKSKFVILLISAVLFTIGEINPVGEHIGTPLIDVVFALVMLLGTYCILTHTIILRLAKAHPFPVLILFMTAFVGICKYQAGKFEPSNDLMLMAALIYGMLPYAVKKNKISGIIAGALVIAVCIGMLASHDWWYLVVAYMYISLATQIIIACKGLYGEKRLLRIYEISFLTFLLIFSALYMVCGTIPRIAGSIEPFSNMQMISLSLLFVLFVFAVVSVWKYDEEYKNYFAVAGLIVFATQIVLFIFSRANPLLSAYLGLPFNEFDFANRVFAMPALVGTILATPQLKRPLPI